MSTRDKVFGFVAAFTMRGYSNTVREIQLARGFRSTSTVTYHLHSLAAEGKLALEKGKARTVRVTKKGD